MREKLHAIDGLRLPARKPAHAASFGIAAVLVLVVALVAVADTRLDRPTGAGTASPFRSELAAAIPSDSPATVSSTEAATPTPTLLPTASATAPAPSASLAASLAASPAASPDLAPAPTPLPSEKSLANMVLKFHVPILEYHRVKPYAGETGYAANLIVPPETFAAQMKAMAGAGYHTITMGEFGDNMRDGIEPAPKSFVVTLDDGYEDGYEYARPILENLGFVATYFVIAGMIDQPDHLTALQLRALMASGNEIGSHSLSHEDLRRYVPSPDRLKNEIYGASSIIAGDVGAWPKSFCYPAGFTNAWVEQEVAATPGIETAVIQSGKQPETWGNRLELPRIRVSPALYPADLVARADRFLP